jgi:hypothetical protein
VEGRRVLLHLMAGSKEDAETVTAFFEDMKMQGLNELAAKVPENVWPDCSARQSAS